MLYDLLARYGREDIAPFHMPGHKRNTALLGDLLPYGIDVTELGPFDNLHDPRGALRETADIAAALYGSRRAFPLVNGATGGILAAVRSAAAYGDRIVMARNCHKAVYNAVEIHGLRPAYLLPETDGQTGICGSIRPEQVEKALDENPGAGLVVVTSPTYEGVVSDVAAIADAAHRRGAALLVDAAHGAHLGFSKFFPPCPVEAGADIVVMSLHKTLPALTQCALAHINGPLADGDRLAAELAVFQTSSPSYVLLASIDLCLRLLRGDGAGLFAAYVQRLQAFDGQTGGLKKLSLLCRGGTAGHPAFFDFDRGKIVINTRGVQATGFSLAERLRAEYAIETEMALADTVVAMTSVCDEARSFERLAGALLDLDSRLEAADAAQPIPTLGLPRQAMTAARAAGHMGRFAALEDCAGRTALEYVWAYPPGVPYLVPGETIDGGLIGAFHAMARGGVGLKSTRGRMPGEIYCM